MKKDTKTFLATVLGVPFALSAVWGVNGLTQASDVVYQRAQVATTQPQIQEPTTTPKKQAPATPVVVKKVPVKTVAKPVTVPTPVVVPVVPVVTAPAPVYVAPQPVVVRPSRHTSAS